MIDYSDVKAEINDAFNNLDWLNLERSCYLCKGDGLILSKTRKRNEPKFKTCPHCNGKCYFITPLGQQILDFVKKHLVEKNINALED